MLISSVCQPLNLKQKSTLFVNTAEILIKIKNDSGLQIVSASRIPFVLYDLLSIAGPLKAGGCFDWQSILCMASPLLQRWWERQGCTVVSIQESAAVPFLLQDTDSSPSYSSRPLSVGMEKAQTTSPEWFFSLVQTRKN